MAYGFPRVSQSFIIIEGGEKNALNFLLGVLLHTYVLGQCNHVYVEEQNISAASEVGFGQG